MEQFKRGGEMGVDLRRQFGNAIEVISLVLSIGNVHENGHVVNQLWGWITKNQGRIPTRELVSMERRLVSVLYLSQLKTLLNFLFHFLLENHLTVDQTGIC